LTRSLPAVLLFFMPAFAASWLFTGNARSGGTALCLLVFSVIALDRAHRLTQQDRSAGP
jgi:hypothetical protein